MLPIQRKISQYNNSSRNGNSIKYIVIHYTANEGDTAKNNVDYFYGGNRSASAHYFVDDNSIWQCVEESRAAWHVGDGKGSYGITNQNSIGIEMCCQSNGEVSTKTENNCIELVKYLQSKHGISNSNVVRHYDASRKICPNWSSNNWSRWWNFKNKLAGSYKEEKKKVKGIVIYSNDVDRRAAEYLADYLKLPTISSKVVFDYTTVEQSGIYAVGGEKGTYTSYLKSENFLAGSDRYETVKLVLKKIGKL